MRKNEKESVKTKTMFLYDKVRRKELEYVKIAFFIKTMVGRTEEINETKKKRKLKKKFKFLLPLHLSPIFH